MKGGRVENRVMANELLDPANGLPDADTLQVLIVDDEVDIANELADAFADEGYVVHVEHSADMAVAAVEGHPEIGVMISDIRMPDRDGLELTRQVIAMRDDATAIEVILITGHATLDDAVSAVRTGAFDFVRKPFLLRQILDAAMRGMARSLGRRGGRQPGSGSLGDR